jgi:uncharacterized protein (TIGR02118 family)
MIKLTVLYGPPEDPEAFEEYYAEVHMPLVQKIPGADRWEAARVVDTMDGGTPLYHRVFEFWFEDYDALEASLGSDEGRAAVADIPNFATGGATTCVSEISEG